MTSTRWIRIFCPATGGGICEFETRPGVCVETARHPPHLALVEDEKVVQVTDVVAVAIAAAVGVLVAYGVFMAGMRLLRGMGRIGPDEFGV